MKKPATTFDFEGHRGCRGLMPENTIPAFVKAIMLGVTTLEMDVVISKDEKVVVSHEPYMSHEICLSPDGLSIPAAEELKHNIYAMTYERIMLYDAGSKFHPRFPQQQKINISKPLLEEVIKVSEATMVQYNARLFYNIEVKSTLEGDDVFHPPPSRYCDLLMEVLIKNKVS